MPPVAGEVEEGEEGERENVGEGEGENDPKP